jgi:hypothetical protein
MIIIRRESLEAIALLGVLHLDEVCQSRLPRHRPCSPPWSLEALVVDHSQLVTKERHREVLDGLERPTTLSIWAVAVRMPSFATGPTLACITRDLRMRALAHVRSVCLPAVGTLAGLTRRTCACCTSLSLTLLRLSLWLLSLLASLALLLPPTDGRDHLIVCPSTLSHSRDDLLQRRIVVVGRTDKLRHVCRPGLDCALKSTGLPP